MKSLQLKSGCCTHSIVCIVGLVSLWADDLEFPKILSCCCSTWTIRQVVASKTHLEPVRERVCLLLVGVPDGVDYGLDVCDASPETVDLQSRAVGVAQCLIDRSIERERESQRRSRCDAMRRTTTRRCISLSACS